MNVTENRRAEIAWLARERFAGLGGWGWMLHRKSEDETLAVAETGRKAFAFGRYAVICEIVTTGFTKMEIWTQSGFLVARAYADEDGHEALNELVTAGYLGLQPAS